MLWKIADKRKVIELIPQEGRGSNRVTQGSLSLYCGVMANNFYHMNYIIEDRWPMAAPAKDRPHCASLSFADTIIFVLTWRKCHALLCFLFGSVCSRFIFLCIRQVVIQVSLIRLEYKTKKRSLFGLNSSNLSFWHTFIYIFDLNSW